MARYEAILRYQARHRAAGLCQQCPRPTVRWGLCARHYAAQLRGKAAPPFVRATESAP